MGEKGEGSGGEGGGKWGEGGGNWEWGTPLSTTSIIDGWLKMGLLPPLNRPLSAHQRNAI